MAFRDIDKSDRMTLFAAFDYFQEAAISHAESLGVGREALKSSGQMWALSRMSVLLEKRPLWKERVCVQSWPRGSEKLFALRDYTIALGDDPNPVIRGRSAWLILDLEKRRPLRYQGLYEHIPLNEGINALTGIPASLETHDSLQLASERKACYSDIDYFSHVNNTRYVQWIQDAVEMDVLEQAGSIRLDINYLREVKPGEVIQIWTMPRVFPVSPKPGPLEQSAAETGAGWSAGIAVEGRHGDDGAVFRANLMIRNDAQSPS